MIDASVAVAVANAVYHDNNVVLLTSDSWDMKILLSALHANAQIVEV